jgi:uncharacterized HhH-GPD family protein
MVPQRATARLPAEEDGALESALRVGTLAPELVPATSVRRPTGVTHRPVPSRYDRGVPTQRGEVAKLPFTGDDEADTLLAEDPFALLVGFVLDQQVPLQKAFLGPLELRRRLGTLDPTRIATMDPAELEAAFRERPALHRFPGTMARRTQELAATIASDWQGDAARVWEGVANGEELERRLLSLPGIGEMKARTLVSILARHFGVAPEGWERHAPGHMCLGDVDSYEKLLEYQAKKRAYKASLRS